MNRVVLIGRLTKDPELRFIAGSGTAVSSVTLAVDNHFRKDASGNKTADFIPVVVWGKQAEALANYMTKGRLLAVSGRIQTRSYEDKEGAKRYVTEVHADEIQFLDKGNGQVSGNQQDNSNPFDLDMTPVDDGDIPF